MSKSDGYERIYELLQKPKLGKRLSGRSGDARYGNQVRIFRADFLAHCADHECIALGCVNARGEALFLVWDIDVRFRQRLPGIREALGTRGWDGAALIIDGSGPGRGKVVLTLATPIPQQQAIRIAGDVLTDAAKHATFGEYSGSDISTFPQHGQGGHARLFGRNRKRRGQGLCEAVLDWNGDPLWCVDVIEPVVIEADSTVSMVSVHRGFHREPAVAKRLLEKPYLGRGSGVFADVLRLAGATVRLDDGSAEVVLDGWCGSIIAQSPEMSAAARAQWSRPDVRSRALRYARSSAELTPSRLGSWKPLPCGTIDNHGISMVPERQQRAWASYVSLVGFVVDNRLDPHAVGLTYARIADLAGFNAKSTAQRAIIDAHALGLLAVLDRGQPVKGGLCSIFTFVGAGETIDTAIARGIESDAFQKRVQDRAARGVGLPSILQADAPPTIAA